MAQRTSGEQIEELERQRDEARERQERYRSALDVLYSVSVACRGRASFREIFEVTYRELRAIFPLDACYIAVCDLVQPGVFRAAYMVDEGQAEYVEDRRHGALTGILIARRAPLLFGDLVAERSRFDIPPDPFGDQQKRSRAWMGVPLLIGQDAVGVISVQSYQPDLYDQDDLDLLQRLGNVVGVALENVHLAQDQRALSQALADRVAARTEELAILSALAAAMVLQRPLADLLDQALEMILPLLDVKAGNVRRLDRKQNALILMAQRGLPPDDARAVASVPVEGTTIGAIVRDNRPVVITENLVRYAIIKTSSPFESLLGVPLRIGDQVVGSLAVLDDRPRSFDMQQIDLLQVIGNQIALAIENARLLDERERRIRELDAIGRIGQLVSASYDLDEMLRQVYEHLQGLTGAAMFYLVICEPETFVITHSAYVDRGELQTDDWRGLSPRQGSLTLWVLQNRRPLLLYDLPTQRDELVRMGIDVDRLSSVHNPRSWVGVPLLADEGQPIGVISVQDYRPDQFSLRTIELLGQVASHLSLGVQKVRLFEQRERQIAENARLFAAEQAARRTADTLREVARVLSSSFDPSEVPHMILRELQQVIPYDTASILLLEDQQFRMAMEGRPASTAAPQHMTFRVDQLNAARLVAQRRAPLVIADIWSAPEWTPVDDQAELRAWLGVPLIAKGQVLGVLNISAAEPNRFSERDAEVALAFASQAAVAMENARLYQESVTRVEQELEIASQIQRNLFPRALPQVAGLELAAWCLPARETGGDFYDVIVLREETGEQRAALALIVGDASGKSIPAAMLMAIARSIARSEARDHQTPEDVMRETNRWIALDVPERSFVALCYATLDLEGRRLALANAGQLAPLRRRAGGQVEYLEVPGNTLPLGIDPHTPYTTRELPLEPGDLLLLYTDGIVEAQDDRHELFGFERLEALVRDQGHLPPAQLIDRIVAATEAFRGAAPQHDDMTIVALRID